MSSTLKNNEISIQHKVHSVIEIEIVQVILNIFQNSQNNFKEKKIKNPMIFVDINEKRVRGLRLYMSKMIVKNHHKSVLDVYNKNAGALF